MGRIRLRFASVRFALGAALLSFVGTISAARLCAKES